MAAHIRPLHREVMHAPRDSDPSHAWLVSVARMDGTAVGPAYTSAHEAHMIARTSIAYTGGTVIILRLVGGVCMEVARYTDNGPDRVRHGWSVEGAASRRAGSTGSGFALTGFLQRVLRSVLRVSPTRRVSTQPVSRRPVSRQPVSRQPVSMQPVSMQPVWTQRVSTRRAS